MNDLVVTLQERALSAVKTFGEIGSFEDLELWLMKGQGLSHNSYKTYMQAIKLFYKYVNGLHPLQWTPGHIEAFYDVQRERNGIATAYNRIAGLKNLCKSIKLQIPFWESPFDILNETLKVKLAAAGQSKKKKALYKNEVQAILQHLDEDTSIKGLSNKAIILTLFTTGLRAQELCDLTYESIEHDTDLDRWYLSGIGKGNKPFHVQVLPAAIIAIRAAFKAQQCRDLKPKDPLFVNLWGNTIRKPAMWSRLNSIGEELKRKGIIRQDIEFSAHLFRRSFLTLLSKGGMNLVAIQEHSRHSSITTLVDHYVDNSESTESYLNNILGVVC